MPIITYFYQILDELKKAGLGASTVFTKKDFEGKSQEDLEKMFNKGGYGGKNSPKNRNKKSSGGESKKSSTGSTKSSRSSAVDDSEHIEL